MLSSARKLHSIGKAKPETPLTEHQRLRRAEMLLSISREIAGIELLDELLTRLIVIATEQTQADRGTLFLNDNETQELYSHVAQGELSRKIRILNNKGIAGHVYSTGEGLIILNAYADSRFDKETDERTGYKTSSILCAPIRTVRGQVIGVIQTLNKKDDDFTEDDLTLLEEIATQASNALQSGQFAEKMKKSREQEMEFLNIVSDVSSEIDLKVLLQRVMGEATRMLNADRSTLFLNDEKTNELWSQVGAGLNSFEIRLPNNAGIAGAVFSSGETVNIPYAYADLRFNPAFDKKTGYFTRSILCVPLVNKKGKVIGCTQVLNKKGGPFSDEDEQRLKAFTGQVSVALENAKLFEDVQKMKNYNESMLESMSNGVITIDEEGTIVKANASAHKITHCREQDILGKTAKEFFYGHNSWVDDRVRKVEKSQKPEIVMDGELEFRQKKSSVNVSVLPLQGGSSEKMGSMIMIEDISSEKRMKSTMSRYMDPALADQLMDGGQSLNEGREVEATLLFTDIRGFTPLTEKLGPGGTVNLLNEYFTIMVDCLNKEGGTLDKFIGDAMMAGFGTLVNREDDPDRAMRAGIAMITELEDWNLIRKGKGLLPVNMGVGVNTDKVITGPIGSEKRRDYTSIGDGVNLAARLESACKQYFAKILVSEYTVRKLKGTYRMRDIDKIIVKGKTQPVGVYEVLDYHTEESFPNSMEVLKYFGHGIKEYRRQNWDSAIEAFQEALKANPNDKLSENYIKRAKSMKANPPASDWDGVTKLTSK